MKKTIYATLFSLAGIVLVPSFAFADAPEKTDGFVCPVLNETVGANNPNAFAISDGDYSLFPGGTPNTISVPELATNADGAGSPGGAHAKPGDSDYTAIWAE